MQSLPLAAFERHLNKLNLNENGKIVFFRFFILFKRWNSILLPFKEHFHPFIRNEAAFVERI